MFLPQLAHFVYDCVLDSLIPLAINAANGITPRHVDFSHTAPPTRFNRYLFLATNKQHGLTIAPAAPKGRTQRRVLMCEVEDVLR
jgi:hypothetical protein